MAQTLFEKYGGTNTVRAVVESFYEKVLANPKTNHHFHGRDLERVKKYQVEMFSNVMGSPEPYTGRDMVSVHTGLGITDEEYNEVGQMLQKSLEDAGVDAADVATIMAAVEGQRGDIVGK